MSWHYMVLKQYALTFHTPDHICCTGRNSRNRWNDSWAEGYIQRQLEECIIKTNGETDDLTHRQMQTDTQLHKHRQTHTRTHTKCTNSHKETQNTHTHAHARAHTNMNAHTHAHTHARQMVRQLIADLTLRQMHIDARMHTRKPQTHRSSHLEHRWCYHQLLAVSIFLNTADRK